ncbi:MAG: kynureninase [Planctomycetota bacterium]|nr:MAG: kynureninase [Planctomycetota bacterium]
MSGDEEHARRLDREDPLRSWRERFCIPPSPAHDDGRESIYLCGNSLGLQPKAVRTFLERELDDWARLGVEGHFHAEIPWYRYHEALREPAARLVGARPHEVVLMNSLTVNLHLLLISFYRPTPARPRILLDGPCFPSDVYAAKSQLRLHGRDPEADLAWVRPRPGEHTVRAEDIEEVLAREGSSIATVLLGGVNYLTGQRHDLRRLARAAHAAGCLFGVDLAHAAGNVPLALHDDEVDFAVWCSYKYLNSGAGAVAGAFVHERHLGRGGEEDYAAFRALPRCEGWWGNDPDTRFAMEEEFLPVRSADAWQLSNPPIYALAPAKVAYDMFDEVGMPALRRKSERLTAYLLERIDAIGSEAFEVVTPRDPAQRGCQLSILVHERPRELHAALAAAGVVCDFREPNVVRVAPTPFYNTFHDCWAFAEVLRQAAAAHGGA